MNCKNILKNLGKNLGAKKNFRGNFGVGGGFTLIELAVVMMIIAILLYGTLSSAGVVNAVKVDFTKERMEALYKALGDYVAQNKRLPCPASINLPKTDANYGKEVRNGTTFECSGTGIYSSSVGGASNLIFGMVPTFDLKLSADFGEDFFGNKFSYFIDQKFTFNYISNIENDLSLTNASFGTAPYKDIMFIKNRNLNGEVLVNNDAIIVLVSHGINGYGAFKNNGQQIQISSEAEEAENSATNFVGSSANFNRTFYQNYVNSTNFDDLVFFKTRNDFVENFNLMTLIPCKGNDINDLEFTKKSVYYGTTIEATNFCANGTEAVKKTKKCDVFGRWMDLIANCPGVAGNSCSVGGSAGMKQKTVNINTSGSDGECEINYAGSYNWACDNNAVASSTNNCIPYCVFAQISGMAQSTQPPATSGVAGCIAGYNGYYEWVCSQSGVASVSSNNCVPN